MPPLSTVVQPVLSATHAQNNVKEPTFKIVLADFALLTSVAFGSLADLFTDSSLMSASGPKAAIHEIILEGPIAIS